MSLSNLNVKATYQGNGSNTTFAIPYAFISDDSAETKVYIRDESNASAITENLQTEGAMQDYTLTGANPPSTPFNTDVEFNTAPSSDEKVIIIRNLSITQPTDLSTDVDLESIELSLDRNTALIQQLDEVLSRSVKLSVTEQQSIDNMIWPVTIPANGIFGFDENKEPKFWTPTSLFAGSETNGIFNTYSAQSISSGGDINSVTDNGLQYRRVEGSGGAITVSVTPFGTTGGWTDGTIIRLIGQSDTNTVTLTNNDATNGAILNGTATLGQYYVLELQWDSSASRWVEIGRNF